MKIAEMLALDAGTVVCRNNKATIEIKNQGGVKTYRPSFPEGMPFMRSRTFADQYSEKTFEGYVPAGKAQGKGGND